MDEHIHIIISIILLLTTLQQSHCQLQPPPQQITRYNYLICKDQFYSCGNLSNISYPFWGGNNRHRHCGGGDLFHLHCHGGQNATIGIGPQNFTVMKIDPERSTMRMVRRDLAHDLCSPQFNDTYLIPSLFRYSPSVNNITIFYNCPSDVIDHGYPIFCNNATSHLGTKDEALEAFPELRRCGRHAQVPVPLEPGVVPTGRKVVELVREEGFEVEYSVDQECTRCLGIEGHCWNNSTDNDDIEQHVQRSCFYSYCPDGSATTTHCSAAHESKQTWNRKIIIVYKGKMPNGCHVAVKILNASKGNGEEFINEVASISRTSHVNVVTLVGFCFEGRKKALIYEFMPNGSLDKFIYNKGPETIASLSWENLYKIAKEIARGLEYLHRGCNTQILHFHIKPHNILLDENFSPKISDFGLAKLCLRKESSVSMSDARGTMGYVAPEVWNRHFGGVSHKSDVYSYGMMLLEMVGARKNINAEASHTSEIYFPHWVYSRLELGSDLRPDVVMATQENEIARRMTIVGLWCIQTLPSDRPAMSRVIDMLEGNVDSLEMPPKPLLSSPTRSLPESFTA